MTRDRKRYMQGIRTAATRNQINTSINYHHNDLTCVAQQARLTGLTTLIAAASEQAPFSSNHGVEPLCR
jgi:hypothetical protein